MSKNEKILIFKKFLTLLKQTQQKQKTPNQKQPTKKSQQKSSLQNKPLTTQLTQSLHNFHPNNPLIFELQPLTLIEDETITNEQQQSQKLYSQAA